MFYVKGQVVNVFGFVGYMVSHLLDFVIVASRQTVVMAVFQ